MFVSVCLLVWVGTWVRSKQAACEWGGGITIITIVTNKSNIQTMMLMMMVLMFQKEAFAEGPEYMCVVYMATLFLTVFRSKPPGDEQISTKGRSSRLFWKARFLASSLKLIRWKVWAHKLVFLLQKLTCIWESSLAFGPFQAHIFRPSCLAHVSSLSAGKLQSDHWKESSYW